MLGVVGGVRVIVVHVKPVGCILNERQQVALKCVPDMDGWRLFSSTYVNEHRLSPPPQLVGSIAKFHDCTRTLHEHNAIPQNIPSVVDRCCLRDSRGIARAWQAGARLHTPRDCSVASERESLETKR